MKKLFLLCLALCLLVCLVGCGKKGATDENTDTGEEAVETYNICGNEFEEYKILKADGSTTATPVVRAAIEAQIGVRLSIVDAMPKDGKVIRFETDVHMTSGTCRIYTVGQALVIAASDPDLYKSAAEQFRALLEEGKKAFPAGYDTSRDLERIALSAVPASATMKIVGDVDRDAISYGIGDRAYLNLAVVANGKIVDVPYFRVQTFSEVTGSWNTSWVSGKNGVLQTKSEKINLAGFYYWNVDACDQNRQQLPNMVENDAGCHFQGAAGFAISDITGVTVKTCPTDFDTFWFGIADEIRDMAIEQVTFRQVSGKEGYNVYYVELRCGTDANGQPGVVSAYLTIPQGASAAKPVKLRIGFQGHGRDAASPDYYENTAALAVCAHSIDSERFKSSESYRNEVYASIDTRFGFELANRENMYFYQMLKRDLVGLRFLVEYCGESGLNIWNGSDLVAAGGSMGGFQAAVMAALARRVTGHDLSRLELTKPWLCDTNAGSTNRRPSVYCPEYRAALGYYDTLNFAHLITCETTIYAGLGDSTCTASAMQSLYQALNAKKSITYEQNVSHNFGAQYHGSRSSLSADALSDQ